MDVMTELGPAGELFRSGDYTRALEATRALWVRLPEPRTEVPDAYNVIEYAVACALRMQDLDQAWSWACLAPSFSEHRQDRGEAEFLVGRVAFARGDMALARTHFLVAKSKSRGRLFEGEDPRYRALVAQ